MYSIFVTVNRAAIQEKGMAGMQTMAIDGGKTGSAMGGAEAFDVLQASVSSFEARRSRMCPQEHQEVRPRAVVPVHRGDRVRR